MKRPGTSYKRATIEQWTSDPCGEVAADGEAGTEDYFHSLLQSRDDYAPWMHDALGYTETGGQSVLDVGCGQGIDLFRYWESGAIVTGVDLTPRHVELAKQHLAATGAHATVVRGDAESLPFAGGTFDRVSSNGVLHHTPAIDSALQEAYRVLRPGGEARIIVYNKRSFHYWVNQVLFHGLIERQLLSEKSMEGVLSRGVEYSTTDARPLVRVYSPRKMRAMLTAAGFDNVETTVRHFHAEDTFVTGRLESRIAKLRDQAFLDRLGRHVGWYVIATGRKRV